MEYALLLSLLVLIFSDVVAAMMLPVVKVRISTSQNDVRFFNIEDPRALVVDVDNQSITYIRLYINETTENQITIMFGGSQVAVMSCNSAKCTHLTNPLLQIMTLENKYQLVFEEVPYNTNYSIRTRFDQRGFVAFTKLALLSMTGNANFQIEGSVRAIDELFVNNSKQHIEFTTNVAFPSSTPENQQTEGSPPATKPPDVHPVLMPLVPTYGNSLAKSIPRNLDERSKRSTGESNSSSNEVCLMDCYCPCAWVNAPKNYTQNEINIMVAAIQERLKVDLKNLSSTQRKLNSMPVHRPSAKGVGVAGLIFLVLILGTIFVFDIGNIIRDLKTLRDTLRDNLRQRFGCKEASGLQNQVAPTTSM